MIATLAHAAVTLAVQAAHLLAFITSNVVPPPIG